MSIDDSVVIEATQFFSVSLDYDRFIAFLKLIKTLKEKPKEIGFVKKDIPEDVRELINMLYDKIEWNQFPSVV